MMLQKGRALVELAYKSPAVVECCNCVNGRGYRACIQSPTPLNHCTVSSFVEFIHCPLTSLLIKKKYRPTNFDDAKFSSPGKKRFGEGKGYLTFMPLEAVSVEYAQELLVFVAL